MEQREKFPLVSGHLSLGLVNTEVVRRGIRHDLLVTPNELGSWINTMEQAGSLIPATLHEGYDSPEALQSLRTIRDFLRQECEKTADGHKPTDAFRLHLEELIARAPFVYKLMDKSLVRIPTGKASDSLVSLVALNSLHLLATGGLLTLHRCANPDCVLLFLDASGNRKWCSMKICGNRAKVARHENKQGRPKHAQ